MSLQLSKEFRSRTEAAFDVVRAGDQTCPNPYDTANPIDGCWKATGGLLWLPQELHPTLPSELYISDKEGKKGKDDAGKKNGTSVPGRCWGKGRRRRRS